MAKKSVRHLPREKQVAVAADGLMMAVWNMRSIIELMEGSSLIERRTFPSEIAGAIRVLSSIAREAEARYQGLV